MTPEDILIRDFNQLPPYQENYDADHPWYCNKLFNGDWETSYSHDGSVIRANFKGWFALQNHAEKWCNYLNGTSTERVSEETTKVSFEKYIPTYDEAQNAAAGYLNIIGGIIKDERVRPTYVQRIKMIKSIIDNIDFEKEGFDNPEFFTTKRD